MPQQPPQPHQPHQPHARRFPISEFTLASALGVGRAATLDALQNASSGLAPQRFETAQLDTWLGVVAGLDDGSLDADFAADLAPFDCRNNRLAALGLRADGFGDRVRAAAARWGAARIGVFLGTSTSGILSTEVAYRHRDATHGALPASLHYGQTHNTYSVARYARTALGLLGPACVLATPVLARTGLMPTHPVMTRSAGISLGGPRIVVAPARSKAANVRVSTSPHDTLGPIPPLDPEAIER